MSYRPQISKYDHWRKIVNYWQMIDKIDRPSGRPESLWWATLHGLKLRILDSYIITPLTILLVQQLPFFYCPFIYLIFCRLTHKKDSSRPPKSPPNKVRILKMYRSSPDKTMSSKSVRKGRGLGTPLIREPISKNQKQCSRRESWSNVNVPIWVKANLLGVERNRNWNFVQEPKFLFLP